MKFRQDFYRNAHPGPEDILLVIEVSDTTLEFDRNIKLPLYARAAISEVLIVNLPDEMLEWYAHSEGGKLQSTNFLRSGDTFESSAIAGLSLDVAAILG